MSLLTNEWFADKILGGLVVAAFAWSFNRLRLWIAGLNKKWSLSVNRSELERVMAFQADAGAVSRFMLQRVLLGMVLLGAGSMLVPVALMDGGLKIATSIWAVIGTLIYGVSIHALATAHRSHDPEKYIQSLKERIAHLETSPTPKVI